MEDKGYSVDLVVFWTNAGFGAIEKNNTTLQQGVLGDVRVTIVNEKIVAVEVLK